MRPFCGSIHETSRAVPRFPFMIARCATTTTTSATRGRHCGWGTAPNDGVLLALLTRVFDERDARHDAGRGKGKGKGKCPQCGSTKHTHLSQCKQGPCYFCGSKDHGQAGCTLAGQEPISFETWPWTAQCRQRCSKNSGTSRRSARGRRKYEESVGQVSLRHRARWRSRQVDFNKVVKVQARPTSAPRCSFSAAP